MNHFESEQRVHGLRSGLDRARHALSGAHETEKQRRTAVQQSIHELDAQIEARRSELRTIEQHPTPSRRGDRQNRASLLQRLHSEIDDLEAARNEQRDVLRGVRRILLSRRPNRITEVDGEAPDSLVLRTAPRLDLTRHAARRAGLIGAATAVGMLFLGALDGPMNIPGLIIRTFPQTMAYISMAVAFLSFRATRSLQAATGERDEAELLPNGYRDALLAVRHAEEQLHAAENALVVSQQMIASIERAGATADRRAAISPPSESHALPGFASSVLAQAEAELPPDATRHAVRLRSTLATLSQELGDAPPELAHEARRLLAEQLPGLIEGYHRIPADLRGRRVYDHLSADQMVSSGLRSLADGVDTLRTTLAASHQHRLAVEHRTIELFSEGRRAAE